jgi:lysine 6-dehydrogenase
MGVAHVLREGEIVAVPTLQGIERLHFPEPVGECEAFSTLGGVSTLPWSLRDRVRNLDYKTVRYPGHAAGIRLLRDLGFFDERPRDVDGLRVAPRAVSARVLAESLSSQDDNDERDLVVFRVEAEGELDGRRRRRRYEMIDFFDEKTGMSAMRRCTAFPASVVLQMLAGPHAPGPGAHRLEWAIDPAHCLRELASRGLDLRTVLEDLPN